MNYPTEVFGDVVVVHTPEEFGTEQSEPFPGYVSRLDCHNVVVDLDHTEILDSAGLTSLLGAQSALRPLGGQLKIATTNLANRKILEITRLDLQLEVFGSMIEAVKSFR
jgi:anti-anti-sigma factor